METNLNRKLYELVLKQILKSQEVTNRNQIKWSEVATKTGIPANSILKFFRDYRFVRESKTLRILCEKYAIDIQEHKRTSRKLPEEIIRAAEEAWDGTALHTKTICALITVSSQVTPRPGVGVSDAGV